MFRVDYLTQDLYFYENATARDGDWDTLRVLRGVSEGRMIRHVVDKKEPLRAELEAFLAAVRGEIPVPITGNDVVITHKSPWFWGKDDGGRSQAWRRTKTAVMPASRM